jgi:hypothetical protein
MISVCAFLHLITLITGNAVFDFLGNLMATYLFVTIVSAFAI